MMTGVIGHRISPLRYQYSMYFIANKLNKKTKKLKHGQSFLDIRMNEIRLPEINVYRFTYVGFRKIRISIYRIKNNKYKGCYNLIKYSKLEIDKLLNRDLKLYKPFKSTVYNIGDLKKYIRVTKVR